MARRQRGEGSIYKRASDGLWVGRVDLGIIDGKRRRKVIYAKTQKAAVMKLAAAKRAVEDGDLNTAGTSVEKWLTYWLENICPGRVKPKTLRTYQSYVEKHLIPLLGKIRIDRLAPADVRALHNHMLTEGRSSTTALHAHRILGTALEDAMRDSKITRNVVRLVDAPSKDAVPQDSLTIGQFRDLMKLTEGHRLQSRWAFGLFLGPRQGECLGLTWPCVDLANGIADLAWQLQRIPYRHGCEGKCDRKGADRCPSRELNVHPGFEYRQLDGNLCLQRPKTKGSKRIVPIPEPLLSAMRDRRRLYDSERRHYKRDHGLVWAREDGRPIDGRIDWAEWSTMLEDLGIPHMKQHAARHTASTIMGALKIPEDVRMSILGHSEVATNRLYTHVDLTQQREAMDTYGAAVAELLA